jgi:hypothetical protein
MNGDYRDSAEIERLWEELATWREGVTGEVCRTPECARRLPGVPPAWIEMLAEGDRVANAVAPWRAMPRFSRYLQASTLDVGIVEGVAGAVMVYLIRDWKEIGFRRHEPGLMLAGVPAPAEAVDGFEAEVGGLPTSLRTAWLAHSFVLLKNDLWLSSILPDGQRVARRPTVIPAEASEGWVDDTYGHFECLEVLSPGSPISGCLVRGPGEQSWRDRVVYREGSGLIRKSHRPTLDDTFTDWEMTEWEDP